MNSRQEFLEEVKKVRSRYLKSQIMGTEKPFIDILVKYDEMYEYIQDGGLLPARTRILPNISNEQQYFDTLTENQRKKYFEEIEEMKRRL